MSSSPKGVAGVCVYVACMFNIGPIVTQQNITFSLEVIKLVS